VTACFGSKKSIHEGPQLRSAAKHITVLAVFQQTFGEPPHASEHRNYLDRSKSRSGKFRIARPAVEPNVLTDALDLFAAVLKGGEKRRAFQKWS
jgi:hypothetical protein